MSKTKKQRGMIFVDAANFYHSLKRIGVSVYRVDFAKLAGALLMGRTLEKIHYYAAPVDQSAVPRIYAGQQRYWAELKAQGINLRLGYLQKRRFKCPKCKHERIGVACENCGHEFAKVEEKGVDVNIAADMVYFAALNSFDMAYLISSDGDLAGACEKVRLLGKRVVYVCIPPVESTALKTACNYTADKDTAFFETCLI